MKVVASPSACANQELLDSNSTSVTDCMQPASIMIKEEASPPSKRVRLDNEIDIVTLSKAQKISSTCSNVHVVTWIKIDKIVLILVDKQMTTDSDKLHDKHIQFGQCMICHQLKVFISPYYTYYKKDTMNSQEIVLKQYFAKPVSTAWWHQICTHHSKAM